MENSNLNQIFEKYPHAKRDSLIPILQDIQEAEGFLSRQSVVEVGKYLKLPASKVYGVATFYNQFSFEPKGQFHIQICRGTACHVKGSLSVLETIERQLGIKAGQTTKDGLFSIEVVACIGACGLAPVISVNGNFHAQLTAETVKNVIESYRRKAAENDTAKNDK